MDRTSYGLRVSAHRKRRGQFGALGLIACLFVFYAVVALLNPWAFHIGERWTPLLYWTGTGTLVTKGGNYPMIVAFFPSPYFSRLHLDGLRPTGGIQGSGLLCTSPGVTQYLDLSGTIYGGWRSADGALINLRVLERRTVHDTFAGSQNRGYFDLFGYWHGQQLRMDDRGEWSKSFRSGLKVEHASVNLQWGTNADFKAACSNM